MLRIIYQQQSVQCLSLVLLWVFASLDGMLYASVLYSDYHFRSDLSFDLELFLTSGGHGDYGPKLFGPSF